MLRSVSNRFAIPLLLSLAAAAILGLSAYRFGLFYDRDFYDVESFLYAGTICWLIFHLGVGKSLRIPAWTLMPFGLFGWYALHLWMDPVSVKGTIDSMLRWIAYGSWSLLLWATWKSERSRSLGWLAIQASGALLLIGGWAGWFGWTAFTDIVLRFNDAQLSATGARLAGFLQYPNAYGALLAAFLLMQLQAWSEEKGRPERYGLASATAIPYGAALLLTESRGAIFALLLGIGLAYFLQRRSDRKKLLAVSGITAAGAALLAKAAWNTMHSSEEVGATGSGGLYADGNWWIALLCVFAGGIVLFLLHRHWNIKNDGKPVARAVNWNAFLPWPIAITGIAVAGWVAFGSAGERITGHYGTVTSRKLFYLDAWEMFKDSPLFGFGGESWRALFGFYQSQPYVGNEVHSGYLEILLDTGIAGLAMLLFMLAAYTLKLWKNEKTAIAPAAVLAAHAAIDFDWSYGYVWLLLIAWFTLHASPRDGERKQTSGDIHYGERKLTGEDNRDGEKVVRSGRIRRRPIGRQALALLLICIAAAGLWAAWRSHAAASAREAAASAASPAAQAAKLRAALDANPAWSRIRLELAALLPLQERASLLEAGLRYDPQAPPLFLRLGIVYAELGDVAQARDRLREALRLERFGREGQTSAIAAMASLAERRQAEGDAAQAREAAEAAVSFYESYNELTRKVEEMPHPANGKQFGMTNAAKFHAAKCLLVLSRNEEASVLLREIIEEGDENWKEEASNLLESIFIS
ncbi:O-antigen ligase family protein [Cohnella luojiensis]|uniref:O-antigen ligase-related domain-containing protein n=1 Tax=Cohnella luojiensis TaxID=652876 RepID=A0A4Y8LY88_9BACL|nr:O-antigen ligase family protein [Cohnella luojiensis]TFE25771.1 hypothetical protein E2980_12685 [Cohnella luojiensis]